MTIKLRRVALTVLYFEMIARDIYFASSERVESSDLSEVLKRLGREEEGHVLYVRKTFSLEEDPTEADIYECPLVSVVRETKVVLDTASSREEILQRALVLEQESQAFYEGLTNHYEQENELMTILLETAPPPESRQAVELFRHLANAEKAHAETIQSWMRE